jgi:hypothetical protein
MGCLLVIGLGSLTAAALYFIGYKEWVFIALGVLWFGALVFSFLFGHRGFGGGPRTDVQIVLAGALIAGMIIIPKYNEQKPCNQAQAALRNLATAEKEYFSQHNAYTRNIDLLKFEKSPHVMIIMLRVDEQSFAASSSHDACLEDNGKEPRLFFWDSLRGGMLK